jgi:hypothetical protein
MLHTRGLVVDDGEHRRIHDGVTDVWTPPAAPAVAVLSGTVRADARSVRATGTLSVRRRGTVGSPANQEPCGSNVRRQSRIRFSQGGRFDQMRKSIKTEAPTEVSTLRPHAGVV